jgi:aminoglycoside 6'-N-acetyltransferase I
MWALLWPDASAAEHLPEIAKILTTGMYGTLPGTIFVSETRDGELSGFLQTGLRSHADGCDTAHAVGFVEGWFVRAPFRNSGVGGELMRAAEAWARSRGCSEIASDTTIDYPGSELAHLALGFEVTDRCINFRRTLLPESAA